jgi:hypothetical protein
MSQRTQLKKEAAASSAREKQTFPVVAVFVSATVAVCMTAIIFIAADRH